MPRLQPNHPTTSPPRDHHDEVYSLLSPTPSQSDITLQAKQAEAFVLDPSRIPRRVKSSECQKKPLVQTLTSTSFSGAGDCVALDPDVEVWLDLIPLSRRPFRNFHRDFSDGVLMAEVMAHFLQKRVDLHNYPPTLSTSMKRSNWSTLNQKVFSKLGLRLSDALIDGITQSKPGYVEKALKQVHRMLENMDRKQLETRAKELSGLASSFDGVSMQAPFVEDWCLVRNVPGEVPDCVIYQNIKYYAAAAFDDVQKSNEQLRERNNELCSKVRRMETLLGLKEAHLNDLTQKIHELKSKFDLVQQQKRTSE